jgi:ketosteroid isomerase-like protein
VHENAAIVRRAYEAFNRADMDTLTELFDESASWHTPGRSPIAGDRESREAVFAQFGR